MNKPQKAKIIEYANEDITERLARFMHETYEDRARFYDWETQEKSRVAFEDLPPENAKTMLAVAKEVIEWFNKQK